VGAATSQWSDEQFREFAADSIRKHSRTQPVSEDVLQSLLESLAYQSVDLKNRSSYDALKHRLEELDQARHTGGNRIFYCAVPPAIFEAIVENLHATGLGTESEHGWKRIVIEKPFGSDLKSARQLDATVSRVFNEDQVYRIDHYLGKETVQNILAFRFANAIFEPVWNSHYVDSVQVTVAEELGVESRGAYYERTGALRDIIQNHGLQLVTLVGMEPPVCFEAGAVRDEKVKVLRALRQIAGADVAKKTVRAQYTRGWVLGEAVKGYREEENVDAKSEVETYVALQLNIDNWRWEGVPFFLRTGKRLPKRVTEIRVEFKRPPHLTFGREHTRGLEPNSITLRIQPEEGISLRFGAKVPSAGLSIRSVNMDFLYMSSFLTDAPDAYERLLMDCMLGDPTLFTRADEVEAAWEFIDPIEASWARGKPELVTYAAGTWGPEAADEMLEREGRAWHRP
jgi:glucose-6-phosphate 1-dehydrogenase